MSQGIDNKIIVITGASSGWEQKQPDTCRNWAQKLFWARDVLRSLSNLPANWGWIPKQYCAPT